MHNRLAHSLEDRHAAFERFFVSAYHDGERASNGPASPPLTDASRRVMSYSASRVANVLATPGAHELRNEVVEELLLS
jgi:hypothetical protein